MTDTDCPHPLSRRDAAALIGILANLEGLVWVSRIDDDDVEMLRGRLKQDGATTPVSAGAGPRVQLRQALNDLNQRLRYTLGEYNSPPDPEPVPR
ncbi:hypothetical protein BJQ94_13480 [Cryobacterium sp. SO2]|uniref:hypothetical protein n=1 Tax=Cryobacterium sp. SO2 TaxID=1897060 RepID=UPI00223D0769|nr:hypothetical protein [Cryobacterium sp. SO2]WEO76370.1 hypothetical protein BJQ94_13480 [Cryobacterium sp. SO2]